MLLISLLGKKREKGEIDRAVTTIEALQLPRLIFWEGVKTWREGKKNDCSIQFQLVIIKDHDTLCCSL